MSERGDFGYGSGRPYRDDPQPVREYRDDPYGADRGRGGYQGTGYDSFRELSDQIGSSIYKINNTATSLEEATRHIGTPKDSRQLRDRIHEMERTTNGMINETAAYFRQFTTVCNQGNQQQRLQYESLKKNFQSTVQRYNNLQKRAADKVKSTPATSQHSQNRNLLDWDDETTDDQARLVEEDRNRQRQQMQAQQEVIDTDVGLLQEREERIRQLESDVLDINELFRDLGTLVQEQGEVINTIEDNVERTHGNVEAGNEQLTQAATYQKKARKKMCILVLILVVIVAIIAIILATTLKK